MTVVEQYAVSEFTEVCLYSSKRKKKEKRRTVVWRWWHR